MDMKILLNTISDVCNFSKECESYFEGCVELRQGNICISGKSVLGIFSLNLFEPLDATIISTDNEEKMSFYNFIKAWQLPRGKELNNRH